MFRVKEILKEKGMKNKDLAEMLGKSKQYISDIVCNRCPVSHGFLCEIAEALDVPLWQMFASPEEVRCQLGESDFAAFVRWRGESRMFATPQELKAFAETLPDDGD